MLGAQQCVSVQLPRPVMISIKFYSHNNYINSVELFVKENDVSNGHMHTIFTEV